MHAPVGAVRRGLILATLVAWAVVGSARLSQLVAPPRAPVGSEADAILPFAREVIPQDAAYLYLEPNAFGSETGIGPRLRYELYPRRYDDLSGPTDEATVRALARQDGAAYVVVPDASLYPPDSFLRQSRPWFRRVSLDATRYVLVLQP